MNKVIQFKKKCIYHEFSARLLDVDSKQAIKCKKCGYIANDREKIDFLKSYILNHLELLQTCIDNNFIELDEADLFSINSKSKILVDTMKNKMKDFIEY